MVTLRRHECSININLTMCLRVIIHVFSVGVFPANDTQTTENNQKVAHRDIHTQDGHFLCFTHTVRSECRNCAENEKQINGLTSGRKWD